MADVRGASTKVEGQTATATALKGNPVLVGGSDGTNIQNIAIDAINANVFVEHPNATLLGSTTLGSVTTFTTPTFKCSCACVLITVSGNLLLGATGTVFSVNYPSGSNYTPPSLFYNQNNTGWGSNYFFTGNALSTGSYILPQTTGASQIVVTCPAYTSGSSVITFYALPTDCIEYASPTGQGAPPKNVIVGGLSPTSLSIPFKADASGNQIVTSTLSQITSVGPTALNTVTSVTATVTGCHDIGVTVVGTQASGTYTVVFEGSLDGTTWFGMYGFSSSQQIMVNTLSATTSLSDLCVFSASVLQQFRVRCTSIGTTPNFNVIIKSSPAGGTRRIAAFQANAVLPTLIENQPTNAATDLSGALYVTNKPSATVAVAGSGTAGTPGTAVLTVQGVASGTALNIAAPTITKGTQASTGLSVQDLKDSGRNIVTFFVDAAAFVTTEALTAAISVNKGGTVTASQTTYTVTTGKTLRIQNIAITFILGSATITNLAKIRIRAVTSGTATVSSGILWSAALTSPTATGAAGEGTTEIYEFPDGMELPSGWNFGISDVMATAASGSWTLMMTCYEY